MAGEFLDMDYMWYWDATAEAEYKTCPDCGGDDDLVALCERCLGAGEVEVDPFDWEPSIPDLED